MLNMRELIPWARGREVSGSGRRIEHPLVSFQREFDRLFDEMWRGFDLPTFGRAERTGGLLTPRIDVAEGDHEIVVKAELPGLEAKDVEVMLTDNVLVIKGEKKQEREEKERGYTYSERTYGAFERRIPIDEEIVGDKIVAEFKNGVLTVTLPKSAQTSTRVRRIPIGATPTMERAA